MKILVPVQIQQSELQKRNAFDLSKAKLLRINPTCYHQIALYNDRMTISVKGMSFRQPPSRSGEVITYGLTKKAVVKIKRAAQFLSAAPACYMITLTYANYVPHKEAKKHLSRFFKRLNYHVSTSSTFKEEFFYVWVAEIQEKRFKQTNVDVIHFHILTNLRFDADFIRASWNETNEYKNQYQQCRVHLTKIRKGASAYLTKAVPYLAKGSETPIKGNRYGISKNLRELMKPIDVYRGETDMLNIFDVFQDFKERHPFLEDVHFNINGHKSCMFWKTFIPSRQTSNFNQ